MATERDETKLAKPGPPERPPLSFLQGLLVILFTLLLLLLVRSMVQHHFFRGSRFLHPEQER
jgi:hypothetical protein